jgi:hypothetical protein
MLKKIVLVGALAVASFLSVNFAAHSTPTASAPAASQPIAAKWPPCDPWTGGGCATAQP